MNLEFLKKEQLGLKEKLNLTDRLELGKIRYIAGVDLTYLDIWKNPTEGIACAVVLDLKNDLKVTEVKYAVCGVNFPYIPTFLSYRELPLVLDVTEKLESRVDVFMLDGMGIMHPRRMGIAAHFGVVRDCMSIGCAKSFLVGDYKEPENESLSYEAVMIKGEKVGYALRSKRNTKPIFISPGNNITCETALEVSIKCLKKHKIPEPTRLAHNYLQIYRKELLKI